MEVWIPRLVSKHIFEAVQKGRLGEVKERLEGGEDVNSFHMMSRTVLHLAACQGQAAVELVLQFNPDLKKVDMNGNTALHQAAFSRIPGSAEITNLLIKAGADLNVQNKFGRSALDECVANDNMDAMMVLVNAGADTKNTLRLSRARGKEEITTYLQSVAEETPEDERKAQLRRSYLQLVAGETLEAEREALLSRLEELEVKETKNIEALKKEKKKMLDRTQTFLKKQTEKLEKEIDKLKVELNELKKEENKKITSLVMEIRDLGHQLHVKEIEKLEAKDITKCLECPVCLGVCKTQIWQCREGHIMCSDCSNRPEMSSCPQCRTSLHPGGLFRNRALEELASKCLPPTEESQAKPGAGREEREEKNEDNDDDDWEEGEV